MIGINDVNTEIFQLSDAPQPGICVACLQRHRAKQLGVREYIQAVWQLTTENRGIKILRCNLAIDTARLGVR